MIFDKKDEYVFCGYDKDVIDLISEIDAKFIGFLTNKKINDFKSLGTHDQIDLSKKLFNKVLVSTEEISLKKKIEEYFDNYLYSYISKKSNVSKYSKLSKKGVLIQAGVHIGPYSNIEKLVKINHNSTLCHDVQINSYSTLSCRVFIGGGTRIGSECFIGANSTIRDHITIGNNSIIGMGSVVTKDVKPNSLVFGNPARLIREI